MAVALIVAAGRGERLGSGRPKALVTLSGRPMLEWSVEALRQVESVTQIVIALPEGELGAAPEGTIAVVGGATRSESVRAALSATSPALDQAVIVHDAARPLAPPELFERTLAALEKYRCDAVIAAVPVSDTIKEVGDDGGTVSATLERSRLWAIQTPQVFRRSALERALQAPPALLAAATDDAWLVEQAGGVVRVTESDPGNIKVTSPADLRFAEMLMAEHGKDVRVFP
ncbi:MAG TPA: 2-C-methyl-D-erythritol 4-phosphate cytidylyltransferase [Solirubrobacteraceae bacterium]|jgi:2-C-methyl-D-erythritol 4-phosphate cytidylyltransferase|nr:2-C-methyl-D-erythritol 4-phosphate cytidylyltransferase [Solirubrobacteraceae bacterium]